MTTPGSNSGNAAVTRADVAQLAVEVGSLGAAVYDMQALIVASMEATQTAALTAAEADEKASAAPSRDEVAETRKRLMKQIYLLAGLAILLASAIAVGGLVAANAYVKQENDYKAVQYNNCLTRNGEIRAAEEEAERSRQFIAELIVIFGRAAERGDKTGQEVADLLRNQVPEDPRIVKPVDCESLRRES